MICTEKLTVPDSYTQFYDAFQWTLFGAMEVKVDLPLITSELETLRHLIRCVYPHNLTWTDVSVEGGPTQPQLRLMNENELKTNPIPPENAVFTEKDLIDQFGHEMAESDMTNVEKAVLWMMPLRVSCLSLGAKLSRCQTNYLEQGPNTKQNLLEREILASQS